MASPEEKANKENIVQKIEPRAIVDEMRESYLDYAMSVIVARALPDVRDGLKPVHRRILFSMRKMGLKASGKTRKSSAIVGHCLGHFHPHGDVSVYEAMVGLAQDFSRRYLLVTGQGNMGSIDGDPPANARYTEAKLSPLGENMLEDLDRGTVDFIDNYDGTEQEPAVLPSPVPQLLLNGSLGIAVGMATNILPHNLKEVCDALIHYLYHPKATTSDLFQWIQGPDFPTGGTIYNQKDLIAAYSQGKGPVVVRGKAEIVAHKKGSQIIISEIPYRVNKSTLVKSIANLISDDKLKGAKTVRDESGREGMRVVIDVSPQGFPQRLLNRLYKYTSLQKTLHMNVIALVDGLQPRLLSLTDIFDYYLKHRREIVIRRAKFDLARFKARRHILLGLIIALRNIDEVIAVIKKSEDRQDAQKKLRKKFSLSELQAEAILEIKLHRLAKLEMIEIEEELKQIEISIKKLEEILASPKRVNQVIEKELKKAEKNFGDARRTKIVKGQIKEFEQKDLIPNKKALIIVTQNGYIKRTDPEVYHSQKRGGKGILGMKTIKGDIVDHLVSVSTHDQLLFFTNQGKVYELSAYEIEEGTRVSRGRGLANYLPLSSEEKLLAIFRQADNEKYLIMATKNGIIKKTKKESYQAVRASGLKAINLSKNDSLQAVAGTSGKDEILLVTKGGKCIRFKESQVRSMGRVARGVKGITLRSKDQVIAMEIIKRLEGKKISESQKLLVLSENGYGKRTLIKNYRLQGRGGRGLITAKLSKKTGELVFAKLFDVEKQDLVVISTGGQIIRTNIEAISTLSRATSGVRVMKLNPGHKVASATSWGGEGE
jgi:DNA gyrase subunit A